MICHGFMANAAVVFLGGAVTRLLCFDFGGARWGGRWGGGGGDENTRMSSSCRAAQLPSCPRNSESLQALVLIHCDCMANHNEQSHLHAVT